MFDDYWIAIIIITIVGFIISIALSFYFIFLPSVRAEERFDIITNRGRETFQSVLDLIDTTSGLSAEIEKDTCKSLAYIATTYFNEDTGCLLPIPFIGECALIPTFCLQYIDICQ